MVVQHLRVREMGSIGERCYEFVLLQQCPTCLVHLIWMVLEMRGRWSYSFCFVGCCFQDLFNIVCSILMQFLSNFFTTRLVSVHVVHPYSRIDLTAAWKKLFYFIREVWFPYDLYNLSIAVHAFTSCILISFSVDEMLLLW